MISLRPAAERGVAHPPQRSHRTGGPGPPDAPMSPEKRKQNQRLALILASIAVVLFIGFFAKAVWFGH